LKQIADVSRVLENLVDILSYETNCHVYKDMEIAKVAVENNLQGSTFIIMIKKHTRRNKKDG